MKILLITLPKDEVKNLVVSWPKTSVGKENKPHKSGANFQLTYFSDEIPVQLTRDWSIKIRCRVKTRKNEMARGNQRELARQKNQKKKQEEANSKKKGDYHKRMQNDGDILREKQKLADERKAAEAAAALAKGKK